MLIQPVKGMTMLQKRIGQVTALYRMLSTGVTQHQLINPSLRYINYQHHRRSDLFCFYDDDTPFTARAFNPTADWTLFSYSGKGAASTVISKADTVCYSNDVRLSNHFLLHDIL